MLYRFLIALILLPLLSSGQDGAYKQMLRALYSETVPLISASELAAKSQEDYILLDAREMREYQVSHIPGALFIGYEGFNPEFLKPFDKSTNIIVYCSVGYRSERIGEKLIGMGFKNVRNLYGGIFQWVNEGNSVVQSSAARTDSVHAYNLVWGVWLKKGIKVYE